jgi:hypothetical protein
MRLASITLNFKNNADEDVQIVFNRAEAWLAPYGTNPVGIVSVSIFKLVKQIAALVRWQPFFLDMEQEEEY